jgi:hypothetical protein
MLVNIPALALRCLGVRPETLARITELSQHKANGCEFQECEHGAIEVFPIPGESAAAVQPRDSPFDDPTLG